MENWLPVIGFEGAYEVSDQGRVRSLDRVVPHALYGSARLRGRLLTPKKCPAATYLSVMLGHYETAYIHRLVLAAFIGPKPEGLVTCHNNGDHLDNRLENLRYDTYSSNVADSIQHGTIRNQNNGKTHCKHGHEFTPENTYFYKRYRQCKTCARKRDKEYLARKASVA